jgi:hypothetical protein
MNQYIATSTSDDDAKPTPDHGGTLPNAMEEIPQFVSQSMSHPNTVGTELIAWTKLDAQWETYLGRASCCLAFGKFLAFPCFWPFVLACLPLCSCMKNAKKLELRSNYWILTDREVIIVALKVFDFAWRNSIQHIPLRNITECYIRMACYDQLPTLCIQIINAQAFSDGTVVGPMEGYGLAGHDWFHTAILRQRDHVASRTITSTEDDPELKCVEEKCTDFTPRKQVCASDATEEKEGKLQEMVLVTSNKQCPENSLPENIGTTLNLPEDVRSMVCWGSSTFIAWSTLDPEFERVIFRIKWCCWVTIGLYGMVVMIATAGILIGFIPLYAVFYCCFQAPVVWQQGLRNTYWILTDRDLILVTRRYWLFPDKIQYISLDHIVNCGTVRICSTLSIYVDTPFSKSSQGQHYVSPFALAESDWFKTAILQQRDQFLARVSVQDRQEGPLPELHHNVV